MAQNEVETGRVLIGVYKIELADGMFVAIDRRTHTTATVADGNPAAFASMREAWAWCASNPRRMK